MNNCFLNKHSHSCLFQPANEYWCTLHLLVDTLFFDIFPMFCTFLPSFCAKGIEIVIKHRDGICCTFAPFFAPFFGTFLKTQSFVPQVLTQVVNLSCYLWRHKESFIWSKLARLCKNEQKELGVLQSRLLFLG